MAHIHKLVDFVVVVLVVYENKINEGHKHIGMVYFALAKSSKERLADREHYEIKWFTKKELSNPEYNLLPDVQFYAREALKRVSK